MACRLHVVRTRIQLRKVPPTYLLLIIIGGFKISSVT